MGFLSARGLSIQYFLWPRGSSLDLYRRPGPGVLALSSLWPWESLSTCLSFSFFCKYGYSSLSSTTGRLLGWRLDVEAFSNEELSGSSWIVPPGVSGIGWDGVAVAGCRAGPQMVSAGVFGWMVWHSWVCWARCENRWAIPSATRMHLFILNIGTYRLVILLPRK